MTVTPDSVRRGIDRVVDEYDVGTDPVTVIVTADADEAGQLRWYAFAGDVLIDEGDGNGDDFAVAS